MAERDMYLVFRKGGMSRAGALGMLGNIGAESNFQSNIVESRCPMSSFDYTYNVDALIISRDEFARDAYGYGLIQWTYYTRKEALYDFAYMAMESIGDEFTQCQFILRELQTDFKELFQFLCTTDDMYEATRRICVEYERPAINNIDTRYAIACRCANEAYDDEDPDGPEDQAVCDEDSCPVDSDTETCDVTVRVLRQGMKGRDVFVLQTAISDMGCSCGVPDGDFGPMTDSGVRDLQRICYLPVTGIAGQAEWQIIFQ